MGLDRDLDDLLERHIRPCVGCGYCCRKAPCIQSVFLWPDRDKCPALYYAADQRKWRCKLAAIPDLYKVLAMGEGCCSPLNSDRDKIPTPEEVAV